MAAETETTPTPDDTRPGLDLSRRGVIRGAAVGGLALPVLAACGGSDAGGTGDAASTPDASAHDASTPDSGGGGALASTADVPSGGGTILADQQIVITQPADGEFKAFTAVCTHQGCIVANVADGTINCTCHGSMFSIEDGSVAAGPATSPLKEIAITVDGDQITEG